MDSALAVGNCEMNALHCLFENSDRSSLACIPVELKKAILSELMGWSAHPCYPLEMLGHCL